MAYEGRAIDSGWSYNPGQNPAKTKSTKWANQSQVQRSSLNSQNSQEIAGFRGSAKSSGCQEIGQCLYGKIAGTNTWELILEKGEQVRQVRVG